MKYIRTDKNGTKYYEDWTCPRCGGAGQSDNWKYTGSICWECGGTGKRRKAAIIKEYTPEYADILFARKKERERKKEEAARAAGYQAVMKRWGFGDDGTGFLYIGNTYAIRDDLADHGARYTFALHWVSPERIKDYECLPIRVEEVVDWFNGRYDISNPKAQAWRVAHGLPEYW